MAKQEVADQELEQEPAQDSAAAEAIRRKELINVGGMAFVFSDGAAINDELILPDASGDHLGLKNAHIYRHPTLGEFVAFAGNYQDIGGNVLHRIGWNLFPYLRGDEEHLYIDLEGNIFRFADTDNDEEEPEGSEAAEPPKVILGKHTDLELIGPAPVCLRCENVHPEGDESAHETRRAHMKSKLDSMFGEGWDDAKDTDQEEQEQAEPEESAKSAPSLETCTNCGEAYDPHGNGARRHEAAADFQIMTMARDRKPNWDAGYAQIDGLARTQMRDWPNPTIFAGPKADVLRKSGQPSRQDFWAKQLNGALHQVQLGWSKRSIHFMKIQEVRDADVLITGGYRSGCSVAKYGPPGGTILVEMLEASGVSRTVGFDD